MGWFWRWGVPAIAGSAALAAVSLAVPAFLEMGWSARRARDTAHKNSTASIPLNRRIMTSSASGLLSTRTKRRPSS